MNGSPAWVTSEHEHHESQKRGMWVRGPWEKLEVYHDFISSDEMLF